MTTEQDTQQNPKKRAIKYCDDLIDYYKKFRAGNRNAWYFSQAATVILSAVTPVLILAKVPEVISAIPPALASVTGGLAVFRWQENWVLGKSTQEALEAELIAFKLGVTEYYQIDEKQALDNFITRINTLHLGQVKEWSTVQLKKEIPPKEDSDLVNLEDPQ